MKLKFISIILAMLFFTFSANAQQIELKNSKEKANQPHVQISESMTQTASVKGVIFEDDFESDLGWTYAGTWTRDTAVAEPAAAYSASNILANPLGTDYTSGMAREDVTSPVIDCSGQTAVTLSYWSFSGCESASFDHIGLEVYDGTTWAVIWSNDDWGGSNQEAEWTYYEFDVTAQAAGNADFQVRFYLGDTDSSVAYSGWAIDDFIISYPEAHDLGVTAVTPLLAIPGNTYTPTATIRNFGANDENAYNVEIEITDVSSGSSVYTDNVDFTNVITAGQSFDAEMGLTWTPSAEGTYTVTATVTLSGDLYTDNDVLIEECTVAYLYFMGGDDVTTCSGIFYDSGGPDNDYGIYETDTMTFTPATSGFMMQVYFNSYEAEGSSYDYLAIYDGDDTNAELIDTHEGTSDDFYFQGRTISATNPNGTLTFEFTSDGSVQMPGWEATLNCAAAVTFHVTDAGATDIEDATVEVAGQTGTTDVDGNALFMLPEGDVTYTVTANFCDPYTNSYVVTANPGQIVEVSLNCLDTYLVTFHAFENFGGNANVGGADITVINTPTSATWNGTTNASGEYIFTLPATDFDFSVVATGYIYSGTTTFSVSGDMTIDLPLDEDIAAPTGLVIENMNEFAGTADFSWYAVFAGSVLVVDHDASNAATYTDDWTYIQPVLDANDLNYTYFEADATTFEGPDLATMQQYDAIIWFTGEGWHNNETMTTSDETNLATYLDGGGKLFISSQDYVWDVYSQADDYTFSAGQFPYDYLGIVSVDQDAWWASGGEHIAHEGATGSLAEGYSFYCDDIYTTAKEGLSADQITDHNAEAMLNVTDAPAGITAIQNGNTVCWMGSVASITDEQVRGDFIMSVLDYLATSKVQENTKSFIDYNVYLDDMGTPVATEIIDSTYNFTGLNPGQTYTAGVSAVYTTGTSDIATIEFTVPELTYTVTFTVIDENSDPIVGANIAINGEDLTTDGSGVATIDLVNGDYDYTATFTDYEDEVGIVTVADDVVNVDISMTAVGVETLNAGISIYPNPSTGVFNVTASSNVTLEVLDITGKLVMVQNINGNTQVKLDNAGMYFFRFFNENGSAVTKVIVK